MTCALCAEERTRTSFPRELENQYGQPACWDCREEECGGCTRKLQRREFAPEELVKRRDKRRCRDCVELRALRECSKCHVMKTKESYSGANWSQGVRRVCNDCRFLLKCSRCKAQKPPHAYTPAERKKPHGPHRKRICKDCTSKRKRTPNSAKQGR